MQTSSLSTLTAAERRIQQLGQTMLALEASQGCAQRDMLRAEGFSTHELDTYGDAARAFADEAKEGTRSLSQGFTRTDEEIVAIAVDAGLGLVGEAAIASAALGRGLLPDQIARNWGKITRLIALKVGTLPMPQVA